MPRLLHRDWRLLILFLTTWAAVGSRCTGSLDSPVNSDPCMDGAFVQRPDVCVPGEPERTCDVMFLLTHVDGEIGLTAVQMGTESVAPWESLHFTGSVRAIGEAGGSLTLYFDGTDPVRVEDVVVRLSDLAGCPDRLEVDRFSYTAPGGGSRDEHYGANRTVPCARRRPAC